MKRILFICVYNSARSQLAEGLARELGKGKLEAYSAGLHKSAVNPTAIEAMKEIGIDISNQYSKPVQDFLDQKFDYVVTMCTEAEGACPAFPGDAQVLHWPFPDPNLMGDTPEERLEAFRKVRDGIRKNIEDLLSTI